MHQFLENPEIIKGENASQLGDILFSTNNLHTSQNISFTTMNKDVVSE